MTRVMRDDNNKEFKNILEINLNSFINLLMIAEIVGAIASILGIWILTTTLVLMALQRLCTNDYELDANSMMTISFIGILINIV